jgi:hypothetical protein
MGPILPIPTSIEEQIAKMKSTNISKIKEKRYSNIGKISKILG